MSSNFPPRATRKSEIEMLLAVLASVVNGKTALYVSAPITSGKRLSNWRTRRNGDLDVSHPDYSRHHLNEVVTPNRLHAQRVVKGLRLEYEAKVLIDPTALEDLPGWGQDDYRVFWGRVIERYADTVVFIDDWQYSSGCAYEFLAALQSEAMIFDERGFPLTLEEGIRLITTAITETRAHQASATFLSNVVEEATMWRGKSEEELCPQ